MWRPKEGEVAEQSKLTLFKLFRGFVCLFVLVMTAFVTLIFPSPPVFLVRFFSLSYARRMTGWFFGHWLSMWPFLFEKINRTRVVFSGDRVPVQERVMVICNHRTEVDWMYIWNLACRKQRIGYVKYALKSSVRNAPLFGWAFYMLEFLLLDRKWETDAPVIASYLSTFQDRRDALWLVVFPEGTDYTEQKMVRSQKFSQEHGLPKLDNVLVPRTKGFYACVSQLRDSLDAVYDLSIAYNYRCPSFVDNLFGINPAEVHINVRRVGVGEVPTSEEGSATWLYDAFHKKDQLLHQFKQQGTFPDVVEEGDLDVVHGLVVAGVFCLSSVAAIYSLLWSYWVRVYVASSCLLLATSTFLNCRPQPIFSSTPTTGSSSRATDGIAQ